MLIRASEGLKQPLPISVTRRMKMNVILAFVIGLVPIAGDIADILYKCNTRNALLLEQELLKRGQTRLQDAYDQAGIQLELA